MSLKGMPGAQAQMTFEDRMAVIDSVLLELETLSMQKATIETAVRHFASGTKKVVARLRMEIDAARELRDSYKSQRDQLREQLEQAKLQLAMRTPPAAPSSSSPTPTSTAVERSQSQRAVRSNSHAMAELSLSDRALSARKFSAPIDPAPSPAFGSVSPRASPFRTSARSAVPHESAPPPTKPVRAAPNAVPPASPPPAMRPPDYGVMPEFRDGNYDLLRLDAETDDGATVFGEFDTHADDDATEYGAFH